MKRIFAIFTALVLLLLMTAQVLAAEFTIDDYAVTDGMNGRSWYQGYKPAVKNHVMTVCLPIRADRAVGAITAELTLNDPNVFLLTSAPKCVTVSPVDGVYFVKLSLPLEKNRRNGDFPATIRLTGQAADGSELAQEIPYIIRIRDGYKNNETLRPVITDVAGSLNVGQAGSLTLTLHNPTTTLSMTDAELTVTDGTGEILMTGSERFLVGEVLPGQTQMLTVPVQVRGAASVSAHTLEVKLSYRVLGAEQTWTERFTVPVTQEIRLEPGSLDLAPRVAQEELGSLSLPLMNMGRGELRNILVTLDAPEAISRQSVLVGTIAAGETKMAKLTFTPAPGALGAYSGVVTVSCEDAYGNSAEQTIPVQVTVEEAASVSELQPEQTEKKKVSGSTITLASLCALLVAALAVQGKILTDKLHKIEEDRL